MKKTSVYQGFQIRDGHGIGFVSHLGDIYPSGFLPLRCAMFAAIPWWRCTGTLTPSGLCTHPLSLTANAAIVSTPIFAAARVHELSPILATPGEPTLCAATSLPCQRVVNEMMR